MELIDNNKAFSSQKRLFQSNLLLFRQDCLHQRVMSTRNVKPFSLSRNMPIKPVLDYCYLKSVAYFVLSMIVSLPYFKASEK